MTRDTRVGLDGPIVVTGGLGFIGSAFIRRNAASVETIFNLDRFTYAADERRLTGIPAGRVQTINMDVVGSDVIDRIVEIRPKAILHFAAESHVTRSETAPEIFFRSNVEGTKRVIEAAERAGTARILHVSTDEVYGPCIGEPFKESDKQPGDGRATSAYARSKAEADDLALSMSSRVPVVVVRMTNCFGPWQHPEKAVGRWITRALRGLRLPVWGGGGQSRDWMHVSDACAGIELLIKEGLEGEVYNLGPQGEQWSNLKLAHEIAREVGLSEEHVYLTAYDRPGHDYRYAVDTTRIRALGWEPRMETSEAIRQTIQWYRNNEAWWGPLIADAEGLYSDRRSRS